MKEEGKHESFRKQNDDTVQTVKKVITSIVDSYNFSDDDNEDIIQIVEMTLYTKYPYYKEKGSLYSWVSTIVHNECRDFIRRAKSLLEAQRAYQYSAMIEYSDSFNPLLIQRAIYDNYKYELEACDSSTLEIKILKQYFILGKPKAVISRELGVSRKTVDRVIAGPIEQLNRKFDEYMENQMPFF